MIPSQCEFWSKLSVVLNFGTIKIFEWNQKSIVGGKKHKYIPRGVLIVVRCRTPDQFENNILSDVSFHQKIQNYSRSWFKFVPILHKGTISKRIVWQTPKKTIRDTSPKTKIEIYYFDLSLKIKISQSNYNQKRTNNWILQF